MCYFMMLLTLFRVDDVLLFLNIMLMIKLTTKHVNHILYTRYDIMVIVNSSHIYGMNVFCR